MMKKKFTATIWKEGSWYVAQCIEVDVVSQGKTEKKAVENLADALQLYFEDPTNTIPSPKTMTVEVELSAV
jgi:predicted RNase H-like HicB family nuclease